MSTPALLLTGLVGLAGVVPALRVPGPLSSRPTSYRIEARLDAPARELHGTETMLWRNAASGSASALTFHLYMNAFKNDASAFFREQPDHARPAVADHRWGFVRVDAARYRRPPEERWTEARLAPEAGGDETTAVLQLDGPVAAGASIEVRLDFTTRLPAIVARAGVNRGFFAAAQWYPKLGVFECTPACAFRADAYHTESEFFADFGAYDVTLDLPRELVVGATGVRVSDERDGPRRRHVFRAEDVHDFAFTADARFVEHETLVRDDPDLPPVRVVVLGDPRLGAHVPRHLTTAEIGLAELGRRLGPYPYGQLTIVQVPPGAEEAGGMEYPTLFFTYDERAPAWLRLPELVTAHELAHQWFQGVLATDEVNEAWLDEGLAELATGWVLQRLAPPRPLVYEAYGHVGAYDALGRVLLRTAIADPVAQPSWWFRDRSAYAELSYRKTALLLRTLATRMGQPAFDQALKAYAAQHRFGHPRGADLLAAFAAAQPSLRGLLEDGLTRAGVLDYAVTLVRTEPARPAEGLFDADGGTREVRDPSPTPAQHRHAIVVEQLGAHALPVTVRARFADGTLVDRLVEPAAGARRWRRIELAGASPLVEAELHPAGDTPIDASRWNDGLRAAPDSGPRRTLLASVQLMLALALGWVGR